MDALAHSAAQPAAALPLTHCMRKLREKRGCLEADRLPLNGEMQRTLCKECARNGQKATCPLQPASARRKAFARLSNQSVLPIFHTASCPASTLWWVL